MERYDWQRLNHIQIGRYAEYFVKMEFVLHGFDVYTSEVDDRGIDFIVRRNETQYFDVQVKSLRGRGYIFFPKDRFLPRENLLAAVVLFEVGKVPDLFLVPSTVWLRGEDPFVSHDYTGKKSPPEWGLKVAKKFFPRLQEFAFDKVVHTL